MHRTALRTAARPAARAALRTTTPRRLASTKVPADKPNSWKGSALRWGLAGAALYYYNTSPIFADQLVPKTIAPPPTFADDELPTVDSVIEEKRKQVVQKFKEEEKPQTPSASAVSPPKVESSPEGKTNEASQAVAVEEGAGALEEEAGQQGAFNPETGEINWDCPCLGGMADGPCGEEFKTAFSCFVYSTEEPKGMDCIEKFSGMQECFRQYPEIYGAELADEEEALKDDQTTEPSLDTQKVREEAPAIGDATKVAETIPEASAAAPKEPSDEVPQAWADATDANKHVDSVEKHEPGKVQEKEEKKN